jgi:hypothetical protein
LAILIGWPAAFITAIFCAVFSALHIWVINPIMRIFEAICGILRKIWFTVIDTLLGPIFQIIAIAFRGHYQSSCPSAASSKSIYNEEVNVV